LKFPHIKSLHSNVHTKFNCGYATHFFISYLNTNSCSIFTHPLFELSNTGFVWNVTQPKYRNVTVTIVTICDSVLWRLKVVTMRLVLESFERLVLASSFWDFLWRPAFILQNPSHCDGHKCDHLWQFCDSLKAVTMRLVLESFKSLVLAGFFWDFLWLFFTFWRSAFILQKPSHCCGHKCNHLWRFCDSLKTVTKKTVIESFKNPSLAGFFVTICDLVYFYTSLAYSTDVLI
jgi:hypothetical protein